MATASHLAIAARRINCGGGAASRDHASASLEESAHGDAAWCQTGREERREREAGSKAAAPSQRERERRFGSGGV